MKLGANILQLLENKNMTQKKLAEITGINPKTLNNYVIERNQPDCMVLTSLAAALDTSPDYLLGLTPFIKPLTKREIFIVHAYRSFDPQQKGIITGLTNLIVAQNSKPKN